MALSMKDPETERLERDLARATEESITASSRVALAVPCGVSGVLDADRDGDG